MSAEGAVDEELRQLERAAAGGGPDEVLRRAAALEREGDRDGAWLALLPLPGRSCPGVLTRLRASPDPCMVDSVRRVGRFELVGELGRGGMGVVHRARDPQTGHEVALKLLQALDPAELARFQVEAEALARVRDPGLVRLLEVGHEGLCPFLVMELVEGRTLAQRLEEGGALPADEALRIAARLARTLERLHARGVVHRDLKPGNVLLTPGGEPVLLDLGLALLVDRSARLTRSGELLGTPAYMAPEQASGQRDDVGPATDVYGLGALLYALLRGSAPFSGPSGLAILEQVLTKVPPPPSSGGRPLPARLDELVLRCLAKDPDQRPTDMDALAGELEALLAAPAPRRGARALLLPLLALLAVGLAAGALSAWAGGGRTRTAAAPDAPAEPDPPRPSLPVPAQAEVLEQALEVWRTFDLERALMHAGALSGEPAHRVRALVHLARREHDQVASEASTARDAAQDDGLRWLNEGLVTLARLERRPALEALTRACDARPNDPDAWFLRARALLDLGDEPGAGDAVDRAISLCPGHALAYSLRGYLREAHDYEGALADETRAFELGHRFATPLSNRGRLRGVHGDLVGAQADLDRAIELEPGSALVWFNRALVMEQLPEQNARALADLDEALRLEPDLEQARGVRGLLRSRLGLHREAVEDLEQVLLNPPADPRQARRLREALSRSRQALARSGGER